MIILALETSCDETSAAVVKDGKEILSNIVASQTEFHKKYGGIVPEIASRKHIEVINPIIQEALDKAKVTFKDLDAVAVTYGPGLVGSLLVGVCAAKSIAYSLNIPLIGVNHLEAHIYANFIISNSQLPTSKPTSHISLPHFPFMCLLVSGGHTMIILVKGHGKYKVLGRTRDDAAGEAFDKVARFLKLGYPGGPIIDKLAKQGNPKAVDFKRPMIEEKFGYDFSFSGIKTAVVNYVQSPKPACLPVRQAGRQGRSKVGNIKDLVASFQQAVVDVLVDKTIRAAQKHDCETICLAGGVAANSVLRKDLESKGQEQRLKVVIPPFEYCTDNAAMVGCAAFYTKPSDFELAPIASLRL